MMRQIRFASFRLDLAAECLWRGDVQIPLRPKTLAVLRHLAERPGELVTRDELLDSVWAGTFVSAELPRISIRELRIALGDDARAPRFIETVSQRGYRFIAAVDDDAGHDLSEGSVATLSARQAARGRAASARIVGRDTESAKLERYGARASRGSGRVVFVTGELGIGKTTLIEAAVHRISGMATEAMPVWVARGQCVESRGPVEPYQAVLDALEQLAELAGHELMADWLSRCAPLWKAHLPAFAGDSGVGALPAGAGGARMRRELLLLLEGLATSRLVVIVLEDLHWSDDATVDLIGALATRARPARLLTIGSFRPIEAAAQAHPVLSACNELLRKREASELALAPLDAAAVLTYCRRRFGADLDASVGEFVRARSEGNPFAMVATADLLARDGGMVHTPRGWAVRATDTDPIVIPDTLRAVAERQLSQLGADEIELIEAASVAGAEFSSQCVAAALERDLADVDERCTRLARQGRFLRDDGVATWSDGTIAGAFGFVHIMYREVLYGRLPAVRRALWHRRIGARLLDGGVSGSDAAARLAFHFERGGEFALAVDFHRRAAEAAAARFAPRAVATSLLRALAMLERLEPTDEVLRTELVLQNALGQAHQATTGLAAPAADAAFRRARELARQLASGDEVPAVLFGLFGVHLSRGELSAAREISTQMLLVGRRSQRPGLRYAGHLGEGIAQTHLGELRQARRHLGQAVRLYPQALGSSPLHPGVPALCYTARVAFHLGRIGQARRYAERARGLARETGNPVDQGWALQLSGVLAIYLRELESAAEMGAALVEVAERNGLEMFARVGCMQNGWARVWLEGEAAVVGAMREAFTWDGLGQHSAAFVVADASVRIGDRDAALAVIDRALELEIEERLDRPELLRLRGEILLADGPQGFAAAEASLQDAIAEARAMGSRMFELRAALGLARLCAVRNQRLRARRLIEPLVRSLRAGGSSADLLAARDLLETLGQGPPRRRASPRAV